MDVLIFIEHFYSHQKLKIYDFNGKMGSCYFSIKLFKNDFLFPRQVNILFIKTIQKHNILFLIQYWWFNYFYTQIHIILGMYFAIAAWRDVWKAYNIRMIDNISNFSNRILSVPVHWPTNRFLRLNNRMALNIYFKGSNKWTQ